MKRLLKPTVVIIVTIVLFSNLNAQNVAITDDDAYTANPSAMLDVKSLTKGMLVPRLTTTQMNAVSSPATGLLIFNTSQNCYYFYNGTAWDNLSYGNAGGIWSQSGSNVYLTNSSHELGIGITPSEKLHVNGGIRLGNTSNTGLGTLRWTGSDYEGRTASGWTSLTGSSLWSADGANIYYDDGNVEVIQDAGAGVNEAIFNVVNSSGDTVFAVYPEGVRIWVADDGGGKASKGGFAVGGFSSAKGVTNEYLRVTPDSVRVYIDDEFSKASKGGFAVGGFSGAKGFTDDYLFVEREQSRVYVDGDQGFAVSDIAGGSAIEYLDLTPDNYFVGHESGISNTTGQYNSFFGYQSGRANTQGDNNVYMGYRTGYSSTIGWDNIFIGTESGTNSSGGNLYDNVCIGTQSAMNNTGNRNVFIGKESGKVNTGVANIFIGSKSGIANTSGIRNIFIGVRSGETNTTANDNIFIGDVAGYSNSSGYSNVFVGSSAGGSNTSGASNIFLGDVCGSYNTTGTGNIFIGQSAGRSNTTSAYSVAIGYQAGYNSTGTQNVFLGYSTASSLSSGTYNTILGPRAGGAKTGGSGNTFVGFMSGYNNGTGGSNVFLGYYAGYNETGSNLLYIDNSSTTTPLIWGDFNGDDIVINGSLKVTQQLYDDDGDPGTSGQILSSTGTGTNWIDNMLGDITGVTAGNGLSGGGSSGSVTLNVGAGDGIDVASTSVSVDVTDIIGNGLSETSNNIYVGAGDGIDVSSSSVAVDVTDILGTGMRETSNNLECFALQAEDGYPDNVVYVNSSGYVGVGTTSPGSHRLYATSSATGSNGTTGYFTNTSSSGIAMRIANTHTSASDVVMLIDHYGPVATTRDFLRMDSYNGGWNPRFSFELAGNGRCDGAWYGGGADYAEFFPMAYPDRKYEPGDVLLLSDQGYAVETGQERYSKRVAGVYSSNPVVVGNSSAEGDPEDAVLVGMMGIIPTKVCTENGNIEVGDFITTSSIPGVAMKATRPGMVIGRALEGYDGNGTGKVKVYVNIVWSGIDLEQEN